VPRLKAGGHTVAMFFSNSNIDTREEYERRLGEARKLAAAEGVPLVADAYDHADWLRAVAAGYEQEPERGRRCERCYRYNLSRTAGYAAAHGFEAFTTSLTVSPHKPSAKIFAASEDPRFLREDFKKKEGFKLSVKRAAELGLYRQAYCGCEFSRRDVEGNA
jgi:predicted adenine nucleotide alpha hydrolase (AANH) superfamily ATPase